MKNEMRLANQCRGAMAAAAIGDALGWPNEPRSGITKKSLKGKETFVAWDRREGGRFYPHTEHIAAGEYSDDTQLLLGVARSILAGDKPEYFARNELPFWSSYERGGGNALLRAANFYKTGRHYWASADGEAYFEAGGNGVVMRILPHVIAAENFGGGERLMRDVLQDGIVTHGHPRALLGATCYAYALHYLLRKEGVLEFGELVSAVREGQAVWGRFPEEIFPDGFSDRAEKCYPYRKVWQRTSEEMTRRLAYLGEELEKGLLSDDHGVLAELGCFGSENGAGDNTALCALYLASRYASNVRLAIKIPALLENADTDTLASVTGGLVGMMHGLGGVPQDWRTVQDLDCILRLTDFLLSENRAESVKAYIAEVMERGGEWTNSPIGRMQILGERIVPCGKRARVSILTLRSAFGQTIYRREYLRGGI